MSQILRAMKTEIIQMSRFYGSQRNMRSHYETLRIPPDASQREIRLAFIKLSKQMHPDLSKKTNHTDFVKINEAYKVLSKEHTRQRYDTDLKFNRGSDGRPVRVVYYESEPNPRQASIVDDPNDPSYHHRYYYGIKGFKRVSNITIAFLCFILSAFGVTIQILVVRKSMVWRRENMLAESAKYKDTYENIPTDKNQQIADLEQRLAAD